MFTISAFADEISPDPVEQLTLLAACKVRYVEFRSIHKTNVLDLTDLQIEEFRSLLLARGFGLSAIGSPIGKVRIDTPFEPHLARFQRAVDLAKLFETKNIRVFSFYPPGEAKDWNGVEPKWEAEVMDRMAHLAGIAEKAGVRLVHENEHRIFGDSPERCKRLFAKVQTPALGGVYDAANYVFCGYDPLEGWFEAKSTVAHLHIKDWRTGEEHGALAGEGHGQWPFVLDDAVQIGYDGFATMEPHLLGGGPTGGVTGPDLFPKAVNAFRRLLRVAGGKEG